MTEAPSGPRLHVVSHVHWDREWYRPHEQFRSRLVELVETVCDRLDSGELDSFHLDGQTITLADVLEVRPELEGRVRDHVLADRLTIGPWHVLADNQLVSTETLVRNLLIARRWGRRIGRLCPIGYSPDAFGHPADLPRLLRGFGIDTALVWRGAPADLARFRWRSPEGSEVFAVNQRYHESEVLWEPDQADEALARFVDGERARLADGPWLLLNGGDHMLPVSPGDRAKVWERATVCAEESGLVRFFEDARAAAAAGGDVPVVEGELRQVGDHLTFLLPGTLSARTYLKQANARAQAMLERYADPMAALSTGRSRDRLIALVEHGWDLAVQNAPHDSVCGCSVDEVHDHTLVRARQAADVADHVLRRGLLDTGLDTRPHGAPPATTLDVVVYNGHGSEGSGPVEVEITTAADRYVVAAWNSTGASVEIEASDLGVETVFSADLDLMPDSQEVRRHRVCFRAQDVPAFGHAVYRLELGPEPGGEPTAADVEADDLIDFVDGRSLAVGRNGSFTLLEADGTEWSGLGRLVDGGDRGDTYNYDPPAHDGLVEPVLTRARAWSSPVRMRLVAECTLQAPMGLAEDRSARSAECLDVPVRLEATLWRGEPDLRLHVFVDNTVSDHRLRAHFAVPDDVEQWSASTHWSVLERPMGPVLGELPSRPGHEAEVGVAPVDGWARAGAATAALAVIPVGLPEVQGLAQGPELAVTLLRSNGWLSRFDLASRTAGAGPMFPTPGAQCLGPFAGELVVRVGAAAADDLALAEAAMRARAPLWAAQLQPTGSGGAELSHTGGPRVDGGLAAALKPADEEPGGYVLRVWNPTAVDRTVRLTLPGAARVREVRLDETLVDGDATWSVTAGEPVEVALGRYDVRSLLVMPEPAGT